MMKHAWVVAIGFLGITPAVGVAQQPEIESPPEIDSAILEAAFSPDVAAVFAHVQKLADPTMKGRRSGSESGRAAADYIVERFEALGLQPAGDDDSFFQPFERMDVVLVEVDGKSEFRNHKVECNNVLAWLPGTDEALADEYLLVGAHYDHLGNRNGAIHPGADDNASGVAGLLAVAQAWAESERQPRRSILFCAFDAEEQRLAGAEHYARHPVRSLQSLAAMINLDMIGRPRLLDRKSLAMPKKLIGIPETTAVGVLGKNKSPELAGIADAVFQADALPLFAPDDFGMLRAVIEKQAEGRSDHAPFERRKIPFLFFSTSEHDDYHQPTDTVDTVDKDSLHRIARAVFRVAVAIDSLDVRPTFVAGPAERSKKSK